MPDASAPARAGRRIEVLAILAALSGLTPLSVDMYLPALPTIGEALGTGAGGAQITLASFFVAFAFGQAFYGPLSDHWGRRPLLYVGMAVFALASVGCALAASVEALTAFRALQGLGACAGGVIARAVVRDLYEPHEVARILSWMMLLMSVAPMLAPLIGGQLLVHLGWPSVFWVLAGLAVVSLLLVLLRLPESHPAETDRRFRIADVVTAYWKVLGERRFLGYALVGGISAAAMFAYISSSPFVFIEHFGVAPDRFGWIFGSNVIGMTAAAQINARLLRRFAPERLLMAASLIQAAAGLVLVATAWSGFGGLFGVLVPLLTFMACNGVIGPNTTALAMAPFAVNAGTASALLGTLQFAIAAVASTLAGLIHLQGAMTMAGLVASCGVAGCAVNLLVRRGRAANS